MVKGSKRNWSADQILQKIEDFWSHSKKIETGCWIWQRTRDHGGDGYGRLSFMGGQLVSAHRLAWELTHGPIPDGLEVLHTCDTPPCINPDHLFLGTQLDNIADKVTKRRQVGPRGDRMWKAKLTWSVVAAIRAAFASGVTETELGKTYGVYTSTIERIVHKKTWRIVDSPRE
jgi:hypothetical protein